MTPIRTRRMTVVPLGLIALYAMAWIAAQGIVSCSSPQKEEVSVQAAATTPVETPTARGDYLVKVLACNDCHTPFTMGPQGPMPDMTKFLSGHPEGLQLPPPPDLGQAWGYVANMTNTAHVGPWGISYSVNLTPDTTTGLGAWTEQMFVDTFRSMKHMGTGRPIMPPMPIQAYSQLKDEDLKAVYAYLRTIPAIKNEVPPYEPPKP